MAIITPEELRNKLKKTYPVLCKDSLTEIDRKVMEVFPNGSKEYLDPEGNKLSHAQSKQVRHLLSRGYTGGFLAYVGNHIKTIESHISLRDPYSISYVVPEGTKYRCQDDILWDYVERLKYT